MSDDLAPAPFSFCPPPDSFDTQTAFSAPAPDEAPPAAPGSYEYESIRALGGFTTHDSGHVTDSMALHGVVVTDRATTPNAAAARADEMTSSLLADHAVRDLSGNDEVQAPPPWWAARPTPPAAASTAQVVATEEAAPAESLETSNEVPAARSTQAPPAEQGPAAVDAPAADSKPQARPPAPPRTVARATSARPAQRSAPRAARRPTRLLAHAAVALVAVAVAGLVGAPTLKQWSQSLHESNRATPAAPPSEAPREHVDAPPTHVADTVAVEPMRRAPGRDQAPPARDTDTSARGAAAAAPSTRGIRSTRRVTAPAPPRATELTARRETVEPLAAAPLAAASTTAIVAPPTLPPPVPVALPPTTALEVTKVDVKPEVVRRVNAHTANVAAGSPEMVVLRVLVSASGSPATVRVLRGSKTDPANDGAAVEAVRQWAFSPALKGGRPVDCWFNVAVPVEGTAQ